MTASAPDLNRAKDLISRELPRYLGPHFEIHHIVADTFHHDDEDLVHIFVSSATRRSNRSITRCCYLKPGHPELDPHLLIRFDDEMHDRFVERGFQLPPAISYSDLQETIA